MTQICLTDVTKRFGGRLVLDAVTFSFTPGEKVSVVGDNGSGKSTLPTNHLAPALVEQLEAALGTYTGTLVVVSHDRRLRERFRGRHLTLRR